MNLWIGAGLSFAAVSLSACHVGPQANNPEGATVEVQVLPAEDQAKLTFKGELLEISDDGIIFFGADSKESADEIIFVAWNRAARVRATKSGEVLSGVLKPRSVFA
jgi:hypothetical protein